MFDQSLKADNGKLKLSLVPVGIDRAIAKVRMWAIANKYKDPDSWRKVEIQRYREALARHDLAYRENPGGVDPESGLPILYHIATNAAFLIELENNGGRDGGVKMQKSCDECAVRKYRPYWCSYEERECKYYDGEERRAAELGDECSRVDAEERRRMS